MVGVAPRGKNIYLCTSANQQVPSGILFSNHGLPQTTDFAFVNGGYYTENGLKGILTKNTATGDVNGDGYVTSADITAIYDVLLGTDNQFEATADVNGDGYVTSADVTAVYDILLGN